MRPQIILFGDSITHKGNPAFCAAAEEVDLDIDAQETIRYDIEDSVMWPILKSIPILPGIEIFGSRTSFC